MKEKTKSKKVNEIDREGNMVGGWPLIGIVERSMREDETYKKKKETIGREIEG